MKLLPFGNVFVEIVAVFCVRLVDLKLPALPEVLPVDLPLELLEPDELLDDELAFTVTVDVGEAWTGNRIPRIFGLFVVSKNRSVSGSLLNGGKANLTLLPLVDGGTGAGEDGGFSTLRYPVLSLSIASLSD